ncbi:restriction endonuclease [Emticicia sp. SJ17W-69]|uniref:restriction endonuclease n=1 Tax=Emticicia sp. SJ17W-69 TaxID=3421657 RepID=UPI003EB9EE33
MSKPTISTKEELRINELSWQNFERMCRDLLESEYPSLLNPRLYLSQGHRQYGIDIRGFDPQDGKYIYVQCKQVKKFSAKDISEAVSLFEQGKFIGTAKTFILCVRAKINEKYEDTLSEIENRLNERKIKFEIWDEKRLNVLLKNYPQIVFDLFDGGNTPDCVRAFNGEFAANNLIHRPKRKEHESPKYYQPRILSWLDKDAKLSIQTTLLEIFTSKFDKIPNLILLKSEATIGKTTELKYIAHHYSVCEKELFFPILISLKNYVNETIQELLLRYEKNWHHISEKEVLLLLDGLDEVKTEERENFIRRLGQFIEAHPNINIILSSRTNFITESTQLKDFEVFYLHEFNENDIESYSRKLLTAEQVENFLKLISANNIKHWLKSPFCLYHFIEFYKIDVNKIPQTRVQLIERILDLKLNKDFERYIIQEIEKDLYRKLLQKLAFAMNLLGRNSLELTELNEIFTQEEFEKIRKMSVVSIIDKSIYFEHNIIQEFLSAQILSSLNFKGVLDFIAFLPDLQKIKPKWFNTIGILLEILPISGTLINQLIFFISEKEPSILGNIEFKFLPIELRFEAFKRIILDPNRAYKRDEMYNSKLTQFAGINENPDVIDFLLELIKTKDGFVRDEAIYNLRLKEKPFLDYEAIEIIDTCFGVFSKLDDNTTEFLVTTLTILEIVDQRMINFLVDLAQKTQNYKLIDDILGYLNMCGKAEDYFQLYLDSIEKYNSFQKNEKSNYIDLGFSINQGLKQIKSLQNLHSLLDYLIQNATLIDEHKSIFRKHFYIKDNFFTSLSNNLIHAYQEDSLIYEKTLKLFLNCKHYHDDNLTKHLTSFFIKTETNERAFWDILQHKMVDDSLWRIRLGEFVNEKILDECFIKYQNREFDNNQMWFIIKNIGWVNEMNLTENLRHKLNVISDNHFVFEEIIDWDKIRKDKKQKDFELLVNKKLFIEKTLHIFEYYGKDELNQDEVVSYKIHEDESDNNVTIWFLNNCFNGSASDKNEQKIKKSDLEKWFTKEKPWQKYILSEFYRLLNDKADFPNDCIDYIQKWCDENVEKLKFSTAITENNNNSWTTRWLEIYYANFFLRLDTHVPENILLDMICFDTFLLDTKDTDGKRISLIDKIILLVGIEKAKVRFLQNLEINTLPLLALEKQISWCEKLNIIEALPFIKGIIEENQHKKGYRLNSILDSFIALEGNITEFGFIFNSFDIDNEFHWYLIDKMVKINTIKKRIGRLLISKINHDNIDNNLFKASFTLIDAGFIEGLEWYSKWYKSRPTIPDINNQINNVSHLPSDNTISIIFDLLKFSLATPKSNEMFTDPIGMLMGLLKPISLSSDESFKLVLNLLNQIDISEIEKNNIYRFKSSLLTFEKDYYLQKFDYQSITEIKSLLNNFA